MMFLPGTVVKAAGGHRICGAVVINAHRSCIAAPDRQL
jgi:hypothetical protein